MFSFSKLSLTNLQRQPVLQAILLLGVQAELGHLLVADAVNDDDDDAGEQACQ